MSQHVGRGQPTALDQFPGQRDEWIVRIVGDDLGRAPVGRLDIRARVATEAHGLQMQEDRLPARPHPLDRLARAIVELHRIGARGAEVTQPGSIAVARGDPPARGSDADPDAVVFADEQQRHGQALKRRPARRVDCADCGRMVGRCIAEAADRDRVARPGRGQPELARPLGRDRDPDRARQVAADGRGLRDHGQVGVTEDLVPATGDRLVGRTNEAQQDIADAVVAGHLLRAGEVEAAGSVVQQRRIGRSQCGRDQGVALVS